MRLAWTRSLARRVLPCTSISTGKCFYGDIVRGGGWAACSVQTNQCGSGVCGGALDCPKWHTYIRLHIVVLDTHRRALLRARPWRYALTIPERNVMQPHAADLRPDPETWSQEGVFKDESPVTIFSSIVRKYVCNFGQYCKSFTTKQNYIYIYLLSKWQTS